MPSDTPVPTADVNIPSTTSSGDTSSGDSSSGDSSWGTSSWGGGYSSQPTYYPEDSSNDVASSDTSGYPYSSATSLATSSSNNSNYDNNITSPVVEAATESLSLPQCH